MNDERDERLDSNDIVARTYRELANERAPATLNEQVLRDAAREAGRRYPRSVGWLRPLAWATTVGLTIAIVVELSEIPRPDGEIDVDVAPAPAAPATRAVEEPARSVPGETNQKTEAGMPGERSRRADRDPASASSAFSVDDASLLEQAADIAATRSGNESAERREIRSLASEAADAAPGCDDDARKSPDTWYQCIEALQSQGYAERAERELAGLRQAFPDFDPEDEAPR